MYAIMNLDTGKFLYGTDYRYEPPHQRTAFNEVETYCSLDKAKMDYKHRRCGKSYAIVEISVNVKSVIEFKEV